MTTTFMTRRRNNYYTASTTPYNSADWRYYPNSADTTNSINFAPAKLGLGSEYGYIKADNGTYHPYGRGGYAHATITPATLQVYDYRFTFTDGSYYTGKVVDDGTFGYKAGYTQPGYSTGANAAAGNYTISRRTCDGSPADLQSWRSLLAIVSRRGKERGLSTIIAPARDALRRQSGRLRWFGHGSRLGQMVGRVS